MFENQFHITTLIVRKLRAELSIQEEQELADWLNADENNRVWFTTITNKENLPGLLASYYTADDDSVWEKTMAKIQATKRVEVILPVKKRYRFPYQIAAAACLLLGIGITIVILTRDSNSKYKDSYSKNDIAAGKNSATLTLANGKKISLADAVNGQLASEAGVKITKTKDGQVVYVASQTRNDDSQARNDGAIAYNTLSTAKGQQYQIILPDGSKVWLNAASSLKYPTSFASLKERKVVLEGEAYFEVTHNARQPFNVQTTTQLIEDIGTAFNVNSYRDEPDVITTLVEGAVRVSISGKQIASKSVQSRNDGVILKPGEQAINSGSDIKVANVDMETVIGWKNGDFVFKGTDFKSAMRKIAKWYDIEVVYDTSVSTDIELGGWISRKNNLSAVLKWIESTNNVHFEIEGRRVIVKK